MKKYVVLRCQRKFGHFLRDILTLEDAKKILAKAREDRKEPKNDAPV